MGKATVYMKSKFVDEGTILVDIKKQKWIVGKMLGEGGFGAIYTASESSPLVPESFDKVIKIEPASNGPLFTEANFYMRVCMERDIKNWMVEKNLKFLGVPRFVGGGLRPDTDDRFLVMDRYGEDLHKILLKTELSRICLLQIAIKLVDVLEYIHNREYSHADIKALNVLRGIQLPNEIYLMDFGMVSKFSNNGVHRIEKPDPKLKHNGTLEFCPRDAHRGLPSSRRSDIESLMFNLMLWLTWDNNDKNLRSRVGHGKLPWLSIVSGIGQKVPSAAVLKQVSDSKEKYMKNTKEFLKEIGLHKHSWSDHLQKLMDYVANLGYTEAPNYENIRKDLAMIICEIKGKPLASNAINLNSFRNIEWEVVKRANRKSSIGTQVQLVNPPLISRKRESSDADLFLEEKLNVKRRKAQETSKNKRVLEVNNSSESPTKSVIENKSTRKPRTKKVNKVINETHDDFSVASMSPERIPSTSIVAPRQKKSEKSKENLTSKRQTTKKSTKVLESTAQSNNSQANCPPGIIIPGMKALIELKAKAAATRCSPRLNHSQKSVPPTSHNPSATANQSLSVSCQTSPSLLSKFH